MKIKKRLMNLLIQMKTTKKNFVEKNKYKYKIIYKNKIYPLQSIFNIIGIQAETSKFKLLCYNHTLDNNEIPEEFPFYQYLKLEAFKNK